MTSASIPEERQRELDGKEVVLAGRFASMSREEARRLIREAGGAVASVPGASTALLLVGQGAPPLGEDGALDGRLLKARELIGAGAPLEIVSEDEFLARLGLEEHQDGLHRLYTTAQLSRILGVTARQIRTWVRLELIRPVKVVRRLCFFDFPQVASAKALSQLTAAGVKPARIRKSLKQLESWLAPQERSLTQLETLEQGGEVVVRTPEGQVAEASGQLRLDFEAEAGAAPVAVSSRARGPRPPAALPRSRWGEQQWFEAGVAAEDAGDLEAAAHHYEKAIELGGVEAEIRFNLGNVLYAQGQRERAIELFGKAVAIDAEYVEAWNNLGNALTEIGRLGEALRAYERALAIEPDYADAHYNLAETWATHGDLVEAQKEWRAYLRLDPCSTWADVVRLRLERSTRAPLVPEGAEGDSSGM